MSAAAFRGCRCRSTGRPRSATDPRLLRRDAATALLGARGDAARLDDRAHRRATRHGHLLDLAGGAGTWRVGDAADAAQVRGGTRTRGQPCLGGRRGPSAAGPGRDGDGLGVGRLLLLLHPALLPQFARADNEGERQLLRLLLAALDEALPHDERVGWSEADAHAVSSGRAAWAQEDVPRLEPAAERAIDHRNLPSARPALQEADDAEALDELGEHLRGARGMSVGPIADASAGGFCGRR